MTIDNTVNDNVISLANRAFDNMPLEHAITFVNGMASVRPESATSRELAQMVNARKVEKSS